MINFLTKKRYYAIFCIKENGTYSIIKKVRVNNKNNTVRYQKKSFPIDIEKPLYAKNNKIFYFFNYKSGNQLLFEKDTSKINTELIDSIVSESIVKQLTANLNDEWKMNTIVLACGIAIGFIIGYIAYPFIFNYQSEQTTTEAILMNLIGVF